MTREANRTLLETDSNVIRWRTVELSDEKKSKCGITDVNNFNTFCNMPLEKQQTISLFSRKGSDFDFDLLCYVLVFF